METAEDLILNHETERSAGNCMNHDNQNSTTISLTSLDLTHLPESLLKLTYLTKLYLDYNDIAYLPEKLGQCLPSLQVISIIGNQLNNLPDTIGEMTKLEEMYLNENDITQLPDSFSCLRSLKVLNVIGNEIRNLPDDIGNLISLEILNGEENKICTLPESIGALKKLRVLELYSNKVKKLPDTIGKLGNLQILNLRDNSLLSLPSSFKDLCSLQQLDLSYNSLQYLPDDFSSSGTLTKLYVDKNELRYAPLWVNDMPNIEELSLKSNLLNGQPLTDSFGDRCKKLKVLRLSGNFMTNLPESLSNLQDLEYIHCGSFLDELERGNFQNGNHLTHLPDNFGWLIKLREVRFDENQLHALPESFGGLINLKFLDLGQNILRNLPESFGQLQALEVCLLSRNQIEVLPESFGSLTSLIDFRIDNNLLTKLPDSFCKLKQLKTLDLFNNRLQEIPQALGYLVNLIRLDLHKNNFGLPVDEVPSIITRTKYAPRDQALSDDWRGRGRKDITGIEIKEVEAVVNTSEVEPEPEVPWNPTILEIAMRRNLSLWKSHTSGATKREKFSREDVVWRQPKQENINREESDDEWQIPVDVSSSELSSSMSSAMTVSTEGHSMVDRDSFLKNEDDQEIEDWDREADEDPYYSIPVYKHPIQSNQRGVSPVDHSFVPDDLHVPEICRISAGYQVEEGQFDDVDSGEENT